MWLAEDDDKLPCGHAKSEAMHPDNQDAYEVRRLQCHACKAIHDDIEKLTEKSATQFLYFVPVREEEEA